MSLRPVGDGFVECAACGWQWAAGEIAQHQDDCPDTSWNRRAELLYVATAIYTAKIHSLPPKSQGAPHGNLPKESVDEAIDLIGAVNILFRRAS